MGITSNMIHKFREYFGLELKDYWDVIGGFDIVKFDDAIATPDWISTAEYIRERHGEGAVSLIRELLNIPGGRI